MIVVNREFLDPIVKQGKKYSAWNKTVDIADHLKFHIDGYVYKEVKEFQERENPYFTILIDRRRPSESDHIREYRRAIYLPVTKQPCFKVLNSLKKGVKSTDWKIDFTNSKNPGRITESESLFNYTTYNLPFFKSVENWFYSYSLKEILSDPNGLICVLPIEYNLEDKTTYRKPFPYFIPSEKVYDYKQGEYAVFESSKTYEYYSPDSKVSYTDNVIYVVTSSEVWEVKKINTKGDYEAELVLQLNYNDMPAWRVGGIYKEICNNSAIYDSFISPIIPGLDAAARESSDLDAEVVQHIFSTMWYYSSQECGGCRGTGSVLKAGKQVICGKCEGNGVISKSPYKDLVVKPPKMDDQTIKAPFAGYIEKNVEIVKIQDERIDSHIYKALSAINMEFLANTPLNQSGKAKEVDRDELNTFVYSVYYHMVENIIMPVYRHINEQRIMDLGLSESDRKEMLPKIPVPERFEILSENYLQEQIVSSRQGNLDPLIIAAQEMDFVSKKFENNPEIRDKIKAIKMLDPFPYMNNEDKDNGLLNGSLIKSDVILSKYINFIVEQALQSDKDFLSKDFNQMQQVVKTLAKDKLTEAQKEESDKKASMQKMLVQNIDG